MLWRRTRQSSLAVDRTASAPTEPVEDTGPPVAADLRFRLDLLRESYGEVLDAVKHQDDKIGRLLTGLSFLTAATLSLAALGGANYVTRQFHIAPFTTPLALIALGAFIVGMVFAVVLLLAAFSTPLRLPGQQRTAPRTPSVDWSNGVKGSPVYFYEIIRLSREHWQKKMTSDSAEQDEGLLRERVGSLIDETHNLAARATYKHERITEATAVVVAALLALLLAATLTLVAAAGTPLPIPTDEPLDDLEMSQPGAWALGHLGSSSRLRAFFNSTHAFGINGRQSTRGGSQYCPTCFTRHLSA
ncbi:hypothetical protein GXP71_00215 [Cellulomonas sp. H30R-01]|uniref:hypothetical protein n=1 Tax=Cellulomonas sp. H30R-01 TaxID=2704467 RepID=UPI00138CA91E|nr:hypothetical protein [Cellulomonas sp. H30R-01]QHT54679.1 hypothetical protein GXP71_00215 [Cellulomonas sp. H30R-01]